MPVVTLQAVSMDLEFHPIDFEILEFVKKEAPFSAELNGLETANKDVSILLEHQLKMRQEMPFYAISEAAFTEAKNVSAGLYAGMKRAIAMAFEDQTLLRFFECEFLTRYARHFVPYARASLLRGDEGLYGRFDFAYDGKNDTIKGMFEFNADTPVMLFESVNMQDAYTRSITDSYNQGNEWYQIMASRNLPSGSWAVGCDTRFVDDLFTCETLCQGIYAATGITPAFIDIKDITFDHGNLERPFEVGGHSLDNIFLLLPWEEMVDGSPAIFSQWQQWFHKTRFYEPPWRWFMSNKGIMALVTHLLETDVDFRAQYGHLPWLSTTLDQPAGDYVKKPIYGRLSQNIEVVVNNCVVEQSDGCYPHAKSIYQAYCPLDEINESKFIACMWMCGEAPASLAFREFDSKISILDAERWIPHILKV